MFKVSHQKFEFHFLSLHANCVLSRFMEVSSVYILQGWRKPLNCWCAVYLLHQNFSGQNLGFNKGRSQKEGVQLHTLHTQFPRPCIASTKYVLRSLFNYCLIETAINSNFWRKFLVLNQVFKLKFKGFLIYR